MALIVQWSGEGTLSLAGGTNLSIPHGGFVNVTSELRGLSESSFNVLEEQRVNNSEHLTYYWTTGVVEHDTGALQVSAVAGPSGAASIIVDNASNFGLSGPSGAPLNVILDRLQDEIGDIESSGTPSGSTRPSPTESGVVTIDTSLYDDYLLDLATGNEAHITSSLVAGNYNGQEITLRMGAIGNVNSDWIIDQGIVQVFGIPFGWKIKMASLGDSMKLKWAATDIGWHVLSTFGPGDGPTPQAP